ncbi:hypothetical protein FQN54_001615 [Arachnomyces sp. PD_36]|nr:hypothetical protein FQN54_001615 [Arachnomyces sp. PD_36]
MSQESFELYGYFRSSCSGRLRIALNLKGIDYTQTPINLLKDEQSSPTHKLLNPSGSVPVLIHHPTTTSSTSQPIKITQSAAALEYLEEINTPKSCALLPSSPDSATLRAHIRSLMNISVADIQPITNARILKRVQSIASSPSARAEWAKDLMSGGLAAYEASILNPPNPEFVAGRFSVGNSITLADVCLVPAVWAAMRFEVDVKGEFPTVWRVYGAMMEEEAVKRAHWKVQPDTPEELRGGELV